MGTIAAVRDGLETRLRTIDGLRVYKRVPGAIAEPALIVKRVRNERTTFAARSSVHFELRLLVKLSELERAQADLEPYIDLTGDKSIIAALEADETLGGAAEGLLIGDWGEDESIEYEGIDYATAALPLEVWIV